MLRRLHAGVSHPKSEKENAGGGLVTYRTHCRCGAKLNYSCEDIQSGQPAEGADAWCSDPQPAMGPHDYGVVTYGPDKQIRMVTVAR